MLITFDNNGYIKDYALIGGIEGGIEILNPKDEQHFTQHFEAYRYNQQTNQLVYNKNKDEQLNIQKEKQAIRIRRKIECFSIIDRSKLWYDSLTIQQYNQLMSWYQAWLNAPQTGIIPEKPQWL